jgi:hypothetical protein
MNPAQGALIVLTWVQCHWESVVLVLLLVVSILPVLAFRFPPFHDYPPWVFQGYLLRLARSQPETVYRYYSMVRTPVPYSAWPAVAWVLGFVVPSPELVGKLFFLLVSLAFVGGASYLIRSVQGRRTALELLPLAWVYNRYVYDGLLNYHLAVGLFALSAGLLHRTSDGGRHVPSRRGLLALSALSVLTYLSHFLGWLPLCLVVAVYSGLICLRRRSLDGVRAMLPLLPAALLLTWYTLGRLGNITAVPYSSLAAKLYAWAPVMLLFFRLDPFGIQPPLAFVLNIVALLAMAAMAVAFAQSRRGTVRRLSFSVAPLISALVCLIFAALIPFLWFGDAAPIDARFIQPAFWLAVASLRYRVTTRHQVALVVTLIVCVLAINVTQFARSQPLLTEIHDTLRALIPPQATVYSVSMRSPPLSLAEATRDTGLADFTVGMPLLDYFDLYRFMAQGGYHADYGMLGIPWLQLTPADLPPRLQLTVVSRRHLQASARYVLRQAQGYDLVELFGYSDDVRSMESLLVPAFHPVYRGTYFSLLARNQAP